MRWRAFFALMHRDTVVSLRDIFSFLVRTLIQPLFLVVILGNVMPRIHLVTPELTTIMLPGMIALSMLFAGMQAVTLPLIMEFGYTKEIEDRLLAPIGLKAVAIEKIVMGALQSILAGVIILPLSWLLMHGRVELSFSRPLEVIIVVLAVSVVSSSFGLFLGALIEPAKIGLMMSTIVAPILFFGCTYYPWRGLDTVGWLQKLVLINPLVYASEGLRATLTPQLPHMELGSVLLGLAASMAIFLYVGIRGFVQRVVA